MIELMESAVGAQTVIAGRRMDYFCGCSYLGLQNHPEVVEAATAAIRRFGLGPATSRDGFGTTNLLLHTENRAAQFMGEESALYFVSGYMGNTILLEALKDDFDMVLVDCQGHYSIFDSLPQTDKPIIPFAHLDADDLDKQIKKHICPGGRPLVICDGVFPITGEISPLPEYLLVLQKYKPYLLCVDDAHALGVLGENGRGTAEYFSLCDKNIYSCGTLSKALGSYGGIIAGDKSFIDKLRMRSHFPTATTAPPNGIVAAAARALEIARQSPSLRHKLRDNINYTRAKLRHIGLSIEDSSTAIICLRNNGNIDLERLQCELFAAGIAVHYLPDGGYSNVPAGGAIRIAVFSTHTTEQIDRLVNNISHII